MIRETFVNKVAPRASALRPLLVVCCLLTSGLCLPASAAPVRAYLYLDPNTARFESLVPLAAMMEWLGEPSADMVSADAQQRVREAAAQKTAGWLGLKLDGEESTAATFRAVIVKGVPGRTEILKPDEAVPAGEAMLGLVWEYDLAAVPEKVEITWDGFSETFPRLITSVIAGSQSEDCELNAGTRSYEWVNRGRLALRSPLAEVPPLPPARMIRLPLGSILWTIFCLILLATQLRKRRKGRGIFGRLMITMVSMVFGAAILWRVAPVRIKSPWIHVAPVPPDQAERILSPLLRNVYRAFDQREEQAIYDVLERSIGGELLQKIYLQIINSLTLDAQDSTRARVTDLDVRVDSVQTSSRRRSFRAEVQWTALGTVGHWGHQHQRVNRYTAKVTVEAVPVASETTGPSFEWKIVGLDVQQETRM